MQWWFWNRKKTSKIDKLLFSQNVSKIARF